LGFVAGNHFKSAKHEDAKELNMMMNIKKFLEKDYDYVKDELKSVVDRAAGYGVGVKRIIETLYLTDRKETDCT
jgi:deoxyribose-phosphate aldolase